MSYFMYRKCVKCGKTAGKDLSVSYYRFPKPGKTNILRALGWAKYYKPDLTWTSAESLVSMLKSLYTSGKIVCGKHFRDSCYVDSTKKRINKYAIPGSRENVQEILHSLRTEFPSDLQEQVNSVLKDLKLAGMLLRPELTPSAETSTQQEAIEATPVKEVEIKEKEILENLEKRSEVLHKFPNPAKDRELFNTWLYAIGGPILSLENAQIFKYRRVCHKHFEEKYWCRNNRLSKIAVPTKYLQEACDRENIKKRWLLKCDNYYLLLNIRIY